MTSFLLIISFLLHIVAFVAIYQLYKQSQLPKQEDSSQDMIEIFEMYLNELKEENKRLERVLLEREEKKQVYKPDPVNVEVEQEPSVKEYQTPTATDEVQYETSLQAQILQLHSQGLSNEEIARKLNSGKTEVDLIVKLHAKK